MRFYLLTVGILAMMSGFPKMRSWDFEEIPEGKVAPGWIVEATGQDKPTATWQVTNEADAPLAPGVLALTATNHTQRSVFNLCWTRDFSFYEGQIAVFLKAHSGKIDQGGGIIWRVQDRNNYYISRYNPLEKNVSTYYVKDGKRVMLGYSGTLELDDGWHLFKIRHQGGRIRSYVDGKMMLMVNAGDYIPERGGVGLWTKADAATSFDNFTVVHE
ncbi:MAG: hypothetical protein JXA82_06060 [Sedimentisphaerales bacterium]|nr:hypothetical protein [Sedimentisphaerales bacterium]